jgi:DNA polymerase III delta subunit
MSEMIKVFYGEDRIKARKAIDRLFGADYEVIEAENLTTSDMASVFLGTSLFGEKRTILVKDLSANKECWEMVPNFVDDCPHDIVLWEAKLDKRSAAYKALSKNKNVEFKEFAAAEDPNNKLVFDILDAAMRGDNSAVKMCEKIEQTNDPYMFMGLMVSQAIKKLQYNNAKAAKTLKILAEADVNMKSTCIEPWTLIKMALLKIASL